MHVHGDEKATILISLDILQIYCAYVNNLISFILNWSPAWIARMDDFALLKLLRLFWRTEALLLFAIYGGSPTITLTELNGRTKCKSVEQWQNCGRRKWLAYNPKDPWSVSSLVLLELYAVYLFLNNQATIDPGWAINKIFLSVR